MTLLLILFEKIVQLSFMGSIIVVCILLSKIIVKDRIGVKFQYAIWFILILRLLLPFTPSSNLSVYNYVPSNVSTEEGSLMSIPSASPQIDEGGRENTGEVSSISLEKTEHKSLDNIILVRNIIPFIWILGVCSIGLIMFINNMLFLRRIRKCPRIKDQHVLSIMDDCKKLMNLPKDINLVEADFVHTPCVFKFTKPFIIIPEKFLEECNLINLKYVLLHELAHIKRKDIFVNYLVSFLSIIYWFNPLIWYGFHKMREDREICSDSLALSVLREEEVISYGYTIIKLAEISLKVPYLPAVAGIINNKSKIKRRITMIKIFKKGSYRLSIIAIAVLIIIGVAFLTGANRTKADTKEDTATPLIIDGDNYTFIDDPKAIGTWDTVDFVKHIEDFRPNVTSCEESFTLLSMTLLPNGQMTQPVGVDTSSDETTPVDWLTWTKGYIIHHNDKTIGKYIIKKINGSKYMFWEWMSGDVMVRGMEPNYYVLKKVEKH